VDEVIEFIHQLTDPQSIIKEGGLWLLLFIIFAETGLFIGFIFPGDSLIFIAGVLCASRPELLNLNLHTLELYMIIAAIIGNVAAYWFGERMGESLIHRKDSFYFKKKNVIMTQEFYDKHGGKTLIIGHFLPIIRSFAPIIAGMIGLNKLKFMVYNVIGAVLWIGSLTTLGYLLGNISWIKNNLGLIVLAFIVATTIPLLITYFRNKKSD
jgi:membrane-associated protein